MRSLLSGISLAAFLALPQQSVTIPHVRSGHAELHQKGRLTVLELTSPKAQIQRIPLTHPSDYPEGMAAPYEARLIAELPNHFLIFTDTFESNPGNIQGFCGASEPGERFVHVVALGALPHETLSVLFESCLVDLGPTEGTLEWHAKRDSAGSVGELTIRSEPNSIIYYISSDGFVSRPQSKPTL